MATSARVSHRSRGPVARPRHRLRLAAARALPNRGPAAGARARGAVGGVRARAADVQAQQWGVRRPGWSRWIERAGEQAPLVRADVVACGSASVAEQVARMGIAKHRIVITSTGSDPDLFRARSADRRCGVTTLDSAASSSSVGSGASAGSTRSTRRSTPSPEARRRDASPRRRRSRTPPIETLARERGVAVVCTGTVRTTTSPRTSRRWTSRSSWQRPMRRSTTRR